jgi:hypothetical protein
MVVRELYLLETGGRGRDFDVAVLFSLSDETFFLLFPSKQRERDISTHCKFRIDLLQPIYSSRLHRSSSKSDMSSLALHPYPL